MSKVNTFDTDISTDISTDRRSNRPSTKSTDVLYLSQEEDIRRMRSSLLLASGAKDASEATNSLRNIAILRVYHQIARVIKFLEYMDKIEEKMYRSIDASLDSLPDDVESMTVLLKIQNALLTNMTMSQKLLEPYMGMIDSATQYVQSISTVSDADTTSVIPKQSRDKIRLTAQTLLGDLDKMEKQAS